MSRLSRRKFIFSYFSFQWKIKFSQGNKTRTFREICLEDNQVLFNRSVKSVYFSESYSLRKRSHIFGSSLLIIVYLISFYDFWKWFAYNLYICTLNKNSSEHVSPFGLVNILINKWDNIQLYTVVLTSSNHLIWGFKKCWWFLHQ